MLPYEEYKDGLILYRGCNLKQDEIDKFKSLIGKVHDKDDPKNGCVKGQPQTISLFGFTSTSIDRKVALTYAFDVKEEETFATLITIHWRSMKNYFVMDMSTYP